MLYLFQSDRAVLDEDESGDAIIETKTITKISLCYKEDRNHYALAIKLHDHSGWLALYTTEARARAVLADLLDHMGEDNLMANSIKAERVQ